MSALLWWIWSFCFQMWMSVHRVTCVWVECVPTRRDPTPAPGVRLATGCHKTARDVKVNPVSNSFSINHSCCHDCFHNTSGQFVNSTLKTLCCAAEFLPQPFSDIQPYLYWCVSVSLRHRWVPVPVYLCQRDLSKLGRLLHLWELPHRVQGIIWRGVMWRLVHSEPLI